MNQDFSFLNSSDNAYLDSLIIQYKQDRNSVPESWQKFFDGYEYAVMNATSSEGGVAVGDADLFRELNAFRLINAYRVRGHLLSTTNPIRPRKDREPHLNLQDYGLTEADLEREFEVAKVVGLPKQKLKNIIESLRNVYCKNIGVEYNHISDTHVRRWFRDRFEAGFKNINIPIEKKKRILKKLNEAVAFENFLQTKYVGQKRFSLEGGENTIPALDAIINKGSELGIEEFIIGMAHRGRLNVLANILGKTYEYIFNEFEGIAEPDLTMGDGDVKYHMGYTGQVKSLEGKEVYLKLMPNPSHLEAVAPVAMGFARCKADLLYGSDQNKICHIQIHGDAAVAGQGLVYEALQMSQLDGYKMGGTIHFVINNQIGFTTNFDDARSSHYCTSVARTLNIPIIHVNGDDAEAVVFACELATEFRQKFNRDIFVDMVCYRKHGHNESDEPKYTQPTLYNLISKHPNPRQVYLDKLIDGKAIESQLAVNMENEFKQLLQDRFNLVKQKPLPYQYQQPEKDWQQMKRGWENDFESSPDTAIKKATLEKIHKALITKPQNFKLIKKAEKIIADREKAMADDKFDWSMGELFAYGSMMMEGKNVRMSGQDCIRGTFSHRHVAFFDEIDNRIFWSLNELNAKGKISVYNSLLSEYAVLGFEYGYSLASPNNLNIWEAQFGDFANGAQTIIDQFISSGESKWQKMSGLVMYLPHGYEGQGPEHSNARPERFLQLSAEYNMIVANLTTPANLFHILRRQQAYNFRKPLIIFTPKSLLRHPECVSGIKDFTEGKFQEVIDDATVKTASKIKKVVCSTGKIYFDIMAEKVALKRDDVAVVRLEQLYPLPDFHIQKILKKYKNAEFLWAQEEPKNMGAYTFLCRYDSFANFKLVSRKSSASPASGFSKIHNKEQKAILEEIFK